MNWLLFKRGKIVWGSKSCVGDDASSLDSDIIVVVGIVADSLHGFFTQLYPFFKHQLLYVNVAATMNWFLLKRGKIVWGSKSLVGDDASSLDSDIVVVGIVAGSLHEIFCTTNLLFSQASTLCIVAATMNWFLFERGNIVWGSKSCCGDVASSLDSDIIVVLGIADVSLHGFFRTTDTIAHGLTIVVPRITGLWVSSDEKDPDVKGVFFIEQLLGIGEDVREDTP